MIYPPPLSVPAVAEEPPAVADAEESPADAEESPADAEESDVKFLLKSLKASTAKSLIFSDGVLVSWKDDLIFAMVKVVNRAKDNATTNKLLGISLIILSPLLYRVD
jgi:hypothetical protein